MTNLIIVEVPHQVKPTVWTASSEGDFIARTKEEFISHDAYYEEWTVEMLEDCFGDDRQEWPRVAKNLIEGGAKAIIQVEDDWYEAKDKSCPTEFEYWAEYNARDLSQSWIGSEEEAKLAIEESNISSVIRCQLENWFEKENV